jgi:sugar (pentulose or hexulose) kinase
LKPFPKELLKTFYKDHGGETDFSVLTASPVLGNLNSGMQLYRLKKEKAELFKKIRYSLHLPQYISYLVTGKKYSEITSIGCHTGLWDFTKNTYHDWVDTEGIAEKLPPVFPSDEIIETKVNGNLLKAGPGLHDSSSALIPYLAGFVEPFILISTGTWCISFNPFNDDPLTAKELKQDCLSYITYQGKPVKASRLFAGNEHEQEVNRLAEYFHVPVDEYKKVVFVPAYFKKIKRTVEAGTSFSQKDLSVFSTYAEAYHQLMYDIMQQQKAATSLVLGKAKVTRIFVDGGFAQNPVYMYMLASAFPGREVFAASVSQASAIGAALAIHKHWNTQMLPGNLVELKYYAISK